MKKFIFLILAAFLLVGCGTPAWVEAEPTGPKTVSVAPATQPANVEPTVEVTQVKSTPTPEPSKCSETPKTAESEGGLAKTGAQS